MGKIYELDCKSEPSEHTFVKQMKVFSNYNFELDQMKALSVLELIVSRCTGYKVLVSAVVNVIY